MTVHFSRDQPGHLPVCTDSTDVAQPIRDQLARTLTNQKPQKGDTHHDYDTTRALYKGYFKYQAGAEQGQTQLKLVLVFTHMINKEYLARFNMT